MDDAPSAASHQGDATPLRVGTRGSPLALAQTRAVIDVLRAVAGAPAFSEAIITTGGDRTQASSRPLAEFGGKGLWAREIHEALLAGRIRLAVHSLKDLETQLPPGIALAFPLPREDARDALILGPRCAAPDAEHPFAALPRKAVVGTSSVRRRAQVLIARPDLDVVPLRGNVATRLARVADGDCDATVLALAGLRRLGIADRATLVLDPQAMLPAAGQGIIAVTCRDDDEAMRALLAAVEDRAAAAAATAERALLAALDGSCHTPIGAHAILLAAGQLHLTGLVARPDGSFLARQSLGGDIGDAARIGRDLGRNLRGASPRDILP